MYRYYICINNKKGDLLWFFCYSVKVSKVNGKVISSKNLFLCPISYSEISLSYQSDIHKYWKLWVCIYICLYVWVCIQENTLSKELNILFVILTYTSINIFHNIILYIWCLKLSGHFWILFPCKNLQNFEERIVLKKRRPSSLVRNAIF